MNKMNLWKVELITSTERRRQCFYLCCLVGWLLFLSVSNISDTRMKGFSWNFQKRWDLAHRIHLKHFVDVTTNPLYTGPFFFKFHDIFWIGWTWHKGQHGMFSGCYIKPLEYSFSIRSLREESVILCSITEKQMSGFSLNFPKTRRGTGFNLSRCSLFIHSNNFISDRILICENIFVFVFIL